MTIKELIDALSEHPPDLPVLICGYEGGYDAAKTVGAMKVGRVKGNPWYLGEYEEGAGDNGNQITALVIK